MYTIIAVAILYAYNYRKFILNLDLNRDFILSPEMNRDFNLSPGTFFKILQIYSTIH